MDKIDASQLHAGPGITGPIAPHGAALRACLLAAFAFMALDEPNWAWGQSPEVLKAYSRLATAQSSGSVDEAMQAGDTALQLTEKDGEKQSLASLLGSLGDYAAGAGKDAAASQYYERQLALLEANLGTTHPDLVTVLTHLADLRSKAKRFAEAATLEERILGIERAVYGEHHDNVTATLRKLRGTYTAMGDTAALTRIDAQLPAPAARSFGGKDKRYKPTEGFASVRVFYGTNRELTGDPKPADFYGKARGELHYGYLDVTIPASHAEAALETQPRWAEYVYDTSELRSRYVILDKVIELPKDDFALNLQKSIKSARSKDVFIFVHGFNNTFEDAARRAAQLAYDVDFDGTPILYSWPSQGELYDYMVDEALVNVSGRKMAEFLETVVNQSGAERVHLLAHSMGNRALIEALQTYLAKRAPDQRQHLFGQIVFTAPDVDRDYFIDAIAPLKDAADRVTLYSSRNDHALRFSQALHGSPRAGTAGDAIIRMAGLDTIDMSSVPADWLGHAYFADNAGAIFDIFRLLWRGDPPPRRCGMKGRQAKGPLEVYEFDADECKGNDLLKAGVMVKRTGDLARQQIVAQIAAMTDPTQKQRLSLILQQLNGLVPSANAAVVAAPK